MDQGVIRSFKAHYRGWVVRVLCSGLDKSQPYSKISILLLMEVLAASWEAVT